MKYLLSIIIIWMFLCGYGCHIGKLKIEIYPFVPQWGIDKNGSDD